MSMLDHLEAMVAMMRRHGVGHLSLQEGGERLTIGLAAEARISGAVPAPISATGAQAQRSPDMGVFRSAGHAGGTEIASGTIIGFVEIDDLRRPIMADAAGVLGPALVADGDVIGYGQPVFEIAPA